MSTAGIVEKALGAFESGDMRTAASCLSGDFVATGILPEAMNRNEFLGLMKGIIAAVPDLSFNVTDVQVTDSRCTLKTHIRGIHSHPLNLAAAGFPPLPATGVEVVLPEEPVQFTVKDDTISSVKVLPVPGGGIHGILEQLGIDLSTRAGV